MAGSKDDAAGPGKLPPELLANIHDRIAFATVFADVLSFPTPWLLLPCDKDKHPATATLFSLADRRAATVPQGQAPWKACRDAHPERKFRRSGLRHGAWRVPRSRQAIEDAIHHDGRFHSVSYSGLVEAWERDAESGAYTSAAVAPRMLTTGGEGMSSRKYLVAAPDGRLMVVVKNCTKERGYVWSKTWTCSFEVHVLSDDGQWKETRDIGDAALFVGLNNSLCVPKMSRPEINAGCVYYTDDQLWEAAVRKRNKDIKYCRDDDDDDDIRPVGVYSLKDGMVKKIDALGPQIYRGFTPPPPVWITPSIP